jgi:hypothetical protein
MQLIVFTTFEAALEAALRRGSSYITGYDPVTFLPQIIYKYENMTFQVFRKEMSPINEIRITNCNDLENPFIKSKFHSCFKLRAIQLKFMFLERRFSVPKGYVLESNGMSAIYGSLVTRIRYDMYEKETLENRVSAYRYFYSYQSFKELAELIRFKQSFYFIGFEKDENNDEPLYDSEESLAHYWQEDRTFVFATIPLPDAILL